MSGNNEDAGGEKSDVSEEPSGKDYPGVPYAEISIRDYGTVKVVLEPEEAPITVENFIGLAESGFYDGLTFHRIMDGFMMQGGDPEGNGTGGADSTIKGEFLLNGVENNISHTKGTISMARSQEPDSASSQFFIVQSDSTFLDGQYAGFGHVTEGIDIVDSICRDAKPVDGNGTIPAEEQPVIESIRITYE
ncbi:MAG TPA: peptidylprolyl isomerase [Lachnospiraceae bacterium]|nr:peptidylprolyl isomerase [Lachnospiraceae bacterium]